MLTGLWNRMLSRLYEARAETALRRTAAAVRRNDTDAAVAGIKRHVLLTQAAGKFASRLEGGAA